MINEGEYSFFSIAKHPAKEKLLIFSKFKEGWNLGEGEGFSGDIISRLSKLIDECLENGLFEFDIFPGLDGDIRLTVYDASDYYEFTVADTIIYCHEKDQVEVECKEMKTIESAISKIHDIGKKEWNLSEYSTLFGMIGHSKDFKAWPSNRARNHYPYLISNALSGAASALVTTYSDSTQILRMGI